MIEALVSPKHALEEPWQLFLLAALFVSLAVVISFFVPSINGGPVVLAMVPAIPLIWTLLVREEHREEELKLLVKDSFRYHLPLLKVFSFFFLGATVAYTFWFAVLPSGQSSLVFAPQLDEIRLIRDSVGTGNAVFPTEGLDDLALRLFKHNMVVLFFMFVFCLLYGIGSIYLLLWNASIIGVFVGSAIITSTTGGLATAVAILPHGVLEIGAYFLATIAGGILSAGIMRRHFDRPEFHYILKDVALITAAAVIILAAAALLESVV